MVNESYREGKVRGSRMKRFNQYPQDPENCQEFKVTSGIYRKFWGDLIRRAFKNSTKVEQQSTRSLDL